MQIFSSDVLKKTLKNKFSDINCPSVLSQINETTCWLKHVELSRANINNVRFDFFTGIL